MTTKELLNIEFSLYGRVYKFKPSSNTTLKKWLGYMSLSCKEQVERIRTHEYKWYKEGKIDKKEYGQVKVSTLPCCTPSAIFGDMRMINKEISRTGIIIIDIDDIDDTDKCKREVMKLPYVFFASLSTSGAGVFCGVYYNKDNDFEGTFRALQKDFKEIGYVVDAKCSDICRTRFASYDSNMLIKNPDAEIDMYDKVIIVENEKKEHSTDKELDKNDYTILAYTIYYLVKHFGYGKKRLPYNEDTSEYDYNCWLLDGYRLSNIGNDEIGLKLYQFISENADGYSGPEDVRKNFYKFQGYSDGYVSIGYYFWLAKELIGDNGKETVKCEF